MLLGNFPHDLIIELDIRFYSIHELYGYREIPAHIFLPHSDLAIQWLKLSAVWTTEACILPRLPRRRSVSRHATLLPRSIVRDRDGIVWGLSCLIQAESGRSLGDSSVTIATHRSWNSKRTRIKNTRTIISFKGLLETYFFKLAFPDQFTMLCLYLFLFLTFLFYYINFFRL